MPSTYVAIDLETTGLDARQDAIIEIGAVRFSGQRIEAEFQELINPGRPIPPAITELTNINDAMVARAPRLNEVLPRLEEFVGNATLIGHNVRFDLGFLQAKSLFLNTPAIDTFELASVLLPTATRYKLGVLGSELGIALPATHRALDDCRVTVGVFRALAQKAAQLPLDVLAEIVNHAQKFPNWLAGDVFEEALHARRAERATPRPTLGWMLEPRRNEPRYPPLEPAEEPTPLEADDVAAVLEPGGAFAQHFPHFEYRSEQVSMLRAVTRALSNGQHLMVEAGTGTGKSVAYLIPAIHWAVKNGHRVVVSTNTINLQEQLIHKDLPDLHTALGLDFRAALLKGRSHYLCPRRLENLRHYGPRTEDELRVLCKTLVWLTEANGQWPETPLTLGMGEHAVWGKLSAEDEGCGPTACQERMKGVCPFHRARKAAETAHVLIINHALLLADVAAENRVLPPYSYLILDEAHHLEAATTDGLSFEVQRTDVERQLKELATSKDNLTSRLLAASRHLPPQIYAGLEAETLRMQTTAAEAQARARDFFAAITDFLSEQREGRPVSDYGQQERILPATRTLAHWEPVETAWEQTALSLRTLVDDLSRLRMTLDELADYELNNYDDLLTSVTQSARWFAEVNEALHGLVFKPNPQMIYWAQAGRGAEPRISLHAAPLHVGALVEKNFWQTKNSVIMASATLTTAGQFGYLKERLNARDVDELTVGSPFHYESSTLLYLPTDVPEPGDRYGYQKAVERALVQLCTATRGRTLALFTAYQQLKQTAQAIRDPLRRAGVDVYDQADGVSRSSLLDSFKASTGAVLLGTKSFWEGVDVPGEALSVLVIVKLPFDVPSDPIIAARSETFERPFDQYSVPEAILKFRQGFGRLIRTKSDKGVVVILDKRVQTKNYGRLFIDSLPACTLRKAPLAQLPTEATRWLGL